MFRVEKSTAFGRAGVLETDHGSIRTPFFMPVATAGAMKGLTLEHLHQMGAGILLCNTLHMHLDPGEDIVEKAKGLHGFVNWKKPILTDSGGYQIFSLRDISSVIEDGVTFRSPRDGSSHTLTPESAMEIQHKLGGDIIMCLDTCPPSTASRSEILEAMERTIRWAKRCKNHHEKLCIAQESKPLLFGIVQGGLDLQLREECAKALQDIGFDGYAVGGLAVGESSEEMFRVLEHTCPLLPEDKPRYLMGVGRLEQIKKAVSIGIDMFDCVLPMREARHGRLFMNDGTQIRINRHEYREDHSTIDAHSPSSLSREHSKSYLHHLFRIGERYGETIACMQNLSVTLDGMQKIRESILNS